MLRFVKEFYPQHHTGICGRSPGNHLGSVSYHNRRASLTREVLLVKVTSRRDKLKS